MQIIKKDGTLSEYNDEKIVSAISKSAERVMVKFTDEEVKQVCDKVKSRLPHENEISILEMHRLVETALDEVNPKVAKSYRDYRNYKQDFVHILDKVFKKSQTIRYIGDRDNANTDSALVPTQRSLIYNELNGELYKKFFLNVEERAAMNEGYIYIHDRSARLDTMNCCLFDIAKVLAGGFEMGNVWYTEPKTLDVAFDVISDITISAAACQYGGFTIPRVDTILAPYAAKSYEKYKREFYVIASAF
ncbi:MAG: ATP cone domain-containing protein, partial [Ruminococcus sp.]|nr:ATP cone domain-containing protein [Ruminococcus sp.]